MAVDGIAVLWIICSAASGLFAGLMLTLVVIMDRMWRSLPASAYIESMQAFLPAAKGNPIITLLTLIPILLPVIALIGGAADSDSAPLVLPLVGALSSLAILLVTLRFNFPIYSAMMSWSADAPPQGWQAMRQRFQMMNGLRFALALTALVCFLVALALGPR
jgi:uncharacterized membrane protein